MVINNVSSEVKFNHEQLKFISYLARELVMPLSFVSQSASILTDVDIPYSDRQLLSSMAKEQLDDWLGLYDSLMRVYVENSNISLTPVSAVAIIDELIMSYGLPTNRIHQRIKHPKELSAVALTDKTTVASAINAILHYSRQTSQQISKLLEFRISLKDKRILLKIMDHSSSLTRSQIAKSKQNLGLSRQTSHDNLTSGLRIILAESLLDSVGARLDFQRINNVATWTIDLPKSRQLELWPS